MSGEWQPIETAPRDGTRILVVRDGWADVSAYYVRETFTHGKLQYRHEGWSTSAFSLGSMPEPTYWQPLPELPAEHGDSDDLPTDARGDKNVR